MAIAEAPSTVEITAEGMSLEDFMRVFDEDGPFELVEGVRIPYMGTKMFGNYRLAGRLLTLFNNFAMPRQLGEAFVEGTFILPSSTGSNWVKGSRIPDVMFVSQGRLEAYQQAQPEWEILPLAVVPDFVIEIISEHDIYADVLKKVNAYLRDGVRLIWVIEPQTRVVIVYTERLTGAQTSSFDDSLSCAPVLDGLEIRLSELLK